jgi:hypothetical protein
MALPAPLPPTSRFAPLHEGHEGGGAFDAYNLTVGGIVLVVLALVGLGIWWMVKRRRNAD